MTKISDFIAALDIGRALVTSACIFGMYDNAREYQNDQRRMSISTPPLFLLFFIIVVVIP